ncbi:MAG: Pleiotropic regulatory protein [Microgenomates group bacterium LiPW_16]|nr:MAG: Pleiotropic regulatory protein [Microgenomates group bacterium LiPW_16]
MFNPIHIGLSPNLKISDSLLALKLLFQPWRWREGKEVDRLENWFKKYLGVKYAVALNSGRSAEYAILKSAGVKRGDEVLLQAFTCVAVPNSILWTGAKPVFVDIEEDSYNIDMADLERKLTSKSRAIIVQHTFGIPAKMDKILKVAEKYHLFVIEDCAHIIKKNIVGDAAFFSFGRDKAVSSVFGGMAIINSKLREFQKQLPYPSYFWIFQQLLHPVACLFILPLYNFFGIGKLILFILQKLYFLSFPVYQEEKTGGKPKVFPAKLPNALAILAFNQLKDLDEFNKKRNQISKFYSQNLKGIPIKLPKQEECPFLRFPILTKKAEELRKFGKRRGIILGDWYSHVVDPKGVDLAKVGYRRGSCPIAEKIARDVVNLPTYPRMSLTDAKKVINLIYDFHQRNK